MKKIIPFLLALLIAISMIACNTESQDEVVSTDLTETEYTVQEEETEKSVEIVEYDLANFEIAFADNLSVDYAFSFQAKIKAATGLNIDVKRFKTQNEKSLFIFGQSDDAVSSKYYVDEYDTYYNHKGVLNNNGRFQVMGVDKLTVNASIDYFCNNVLTGGKTTFSAPTEGAVSEIITLESISLPERADESYLRIVSNNILLQSLDSSPERLYGLKAAFKFYDADIFGLQEVDDLWHTIGKLDVTMESLGYSMVPIKPTDSKYANLKDKDIRNPIYYKTDKFELVDCGYDRYAATEFDNGEYPSSSYTWACLKLKDSGKQLIFFSTHLVARINHAGATTAQTSKSANTYRNESAKELISVIDKLAVKYPNVPVISVGDYNNNYESQTYGTMISKMYSARGRAEKRVNMTYHSSGNPIGGEPPKGKAIDHVFYSKYGIVAKHFETLVSPYSYAYSDHVPVLFDFILT